MDMYFHAGSRVKPWRVKMCMQMRASRKEHKNNECWTQFDLMRSGGQFKETKERIIVEYERRFLVRHCSFFLLL